MTPEYSTKFDRLQRLLMNNSTAISLKPLLLRCSHSQGIPSPLLYLITLPLSTSSKGQVLHPQLLPKKRRMTIRCPHIWLVYDGCAYVSTLRTLCGVAAQYRYRSYKRVPLPFCSLSIAIAGYSLQPMRPIL